MGLYLREMGVGEGGEGGGGKPGRRNLENCS